MMDNPLISIIIPSFNRALFIAQTLNSVLGQTQKNWECIIVDDCSEDNTEEVVNEFVNKDGRFRFLTREVKQKGASVCRNIGANIAKSEFLLFLDSDDLLAPFCLEQRLAKIVNIKKDFFVFPISNFLHVTDDLPDSKWSVTFDKNTALLGFLTHRVCWSIMSVVWKKEYFLKLNGFSTLYERFQDVELHVRALFNGASFQAFDTQPDAFYRILPKGNEKKGFVLAPKVIRSAILLYTMIASDYPIPFKQKQIFEACKKGYWYLLVSMNETICKQDPELHQQYLKLGLTYNLLSFKKLMLYKLLIRMNKLELHTKKGFGYYRYKSAISNI